MRRTLVPLVLLLSCNGGEPEPEPVLDLTEVLGDDEVRAGVITQADALIGGMAGESQLGDVLLYNSKVRFVIQAKRDGGGLASQGGALIDADVVRAPGEADADLVTDWLVMVDLGHVPEADSVEVIDDGTTSGTAIVRVTGHESNLDYLAGALENPGLSVQYGLSFTTDYKLAAGSPLVEVKTTLTLDGEPVRVEPGDVLMDIAGVGSAWAPGAGRVERTPARLDWLAYAEDEGRVVLGMFVDTPGRAAHPSAALDLVNFLISLSSLYQEPVDLEAGTPHSWTRYLGVGRSVSELSDAWMRATGTASRTAEATVTAADGPVAGARVTVLVDDVPWTLATSDAAGHVAVSVPAQGLVRFVADGSGSRIVDDLPDGAGDYGPLASAASQARTLETVRSGGVAAAHARGRGRAEAAEGEPLTLGVPATLRIVAPDGLPFEARVRALDAAVPDDAYNTEPVGGLAALAYPTSGTVDVPIEPGTYEILVQRGARYELHVQEVTLTAGELTTVTAGDLVAAYDSTGWFTADTHIHAAPSSDGKLTISDRVLTMAGTGVDLYFGTEHDAAGDPRPLVEAMGLANVLYAVPSVEVSPVMRGHANVFPVVPDPALPNGGAWRWWMDPVVDSNEHFDRVREAHPDALVQINHPFSPGMPSLAGWEPGFVQHADLWWDGFDLLEVVHGRREDSNVALYLDLLSRGVVVTPMGNTDAHDHLTNDPGLNVTWIAMDAPGVSALTDDALVEALRAHRTVASNGPFLDLDVLPGETLTTSTTLHVTARSPSWMKVDRVELLRDGEVVQTVEGTTATFTLDADQDAVFVVTASGDTSMSPIGGHPPFAITGPYLFDGDGGGWTAPLPPLVVGE